MVPSKSRRQLIASEEINVLGKKTNIFLGCDANCSAGRGHV
jgi:hypothetical protein